MAVSRQRAINDIFRKTQAMGDHIISSDAEFVIEGYEDSALLAKNFPMPVLSAGDGIEVPMPMGVMGWQASQVEVAQQGAITFHETVYGHSVQLMRDLIRNGGTFNARVYEGTRESNLRSYGLVKCHIKLDPAERDWESKTQLMIYTGTLFYHYFGDMFDSDGNPQEAFPSFNG